MITLTIDHIVSDARKHGGKPHIAGKGITVQHIAALHNLGWSVKDLSEEFEITAGQVYAALSYYADHQDDIDRAISTAQDQVQHIGITIEDWQRRIAARQGGC